MNAIRYALGSFLISIGFFVLSHVVGFIGSSEGMLWIVNADLLTLAGWIFLGVFMLFVLAMAVEWTSQGVEPRR